MTVVTSHARSRYRRPSRLLCGLIGVALYAGCDRNPCPSETSASVREGRCVEREYDAVPEPVFPGLVDDNEHDSAASTDPPSTDVDAGGGEGNEGDQPDDDGAEPMGEASPPENPSPGTAEAGVTPSPNEAGTSPPDVAGGQDAGTPIDGAVARDGGRTVFRPPASPWQLVAGSASMIAVGANGDVWSLGTTPVSTRGMGVFKRVGDAWTEVLSGGAVNIAVNPSGIPWIIDADGNLFGGTDSSTHVSWSHVATGVADLAFSAFGDLWLIGTDGRAYRVLNGSFDSGGDSFTLALRLAVTPNGVPWIVDSPERIFERASATPNQLGWMLRHGTGAADISIAPDGTVFVLGDTIGPGGRLVKYLNRDQAWVPLDESVGGRSIAAGLSDVWIVDAQGRIYRHDRAALP